MEVKGTFLASVNQRSVQHKVTERRRRWCKALQQAVRPDGATSRLYAIITILTGRRAPDENFSETLLVKIKHLQCSYQGCNHFQSINLQNIFSSDRLIFCYLTENDNSAISWLIFKQFLKLKYEYLQVFNNIIGLLVCLLNYFQTFFRLLVKKTIGRWTDNR